MTYFKIFMALMIFYGLSVALPITAYAQATSGIGEVEMGMVALLVFGARQLAEILSKLIPDSKKGWAMWVRRLLKIAALYIPNK